MMKAAVHEAGDILDVLVDRAEEGEEVFITRRSRVEVQLVPVAGRRTVTADEVRAAFKDVPVVNDIASGELLRQTRLTDDAV